jgi:hypothetical protein
MVESQTAEAAENPAAPTEKPSPKDQAHHLEICIKISVRSSSHKMEGKETYNP